MSVANNNWGELREPRMGLMLHYDASSSDAGALDWLTKDPRCKVSYNWLVLDNAHIHAIAPGDKRAWHAGVCRSSDIRLPYTDANSAFIGIAIAATDGETATEAQMDSTVLLCQSLMLAHRWHRSETWRIVGHDTEAWPRGRKHDPTGSNPEKPVLSVAEVRRRVSHNVGMTG